MPPWPEGARSTREGSAIPTVDLTPRLARESKPGDKDTVLFDKSLPGFGLRIHPPDARSITSRPASRDGAAVSSSHGMA